MTEQQQQEALEKKEREIYGRYWIWEGYFNEKNKQQWLDTAEMLKHINVHVLQDIEDAILLEGFKEIKQVKKIEDKIEFDETERIHNQQKLIEEDKRAEFKEVKSKEIKKRKDFYQLRPPECWNFFDDSPEEQQAKHVLRANADPLNLKIYSDGRVEKIMKNIEEIGINLSRYEQSNWDLLRKRTLEIFQKEFKAYQDKLSTTGGGDKK